MEKLRSEVSEKIRSAIKAKLLEIGAYVDEELPDYILVMVANKRSKAQMDADLSLFLGSHTERFTDWLQGVLLKLQQITVPAAPPLQTSVEDKQKSKAASETDVPASTVPEKSKTKSDKGKTEARREKTTAAESSPSRKYDLVKNEDEEDGELEYVPSSIVHSSTSNALVVNKEADNEEADEDYLMIRYDMDNDSAPEEDVVDKYRNPEPPSPTRVSPIDDTSVVVGENQAATKRRVICLNEDEEFHQTAKKPRRNASVVERVSVKSRIGAVKTSGPRAADLSNKSGSRRFVQEDDGEEDDENRPRKPFSGIASVVNVTERPRSHPSSQANKSLVLKAVAEAEKSIVARKVSRENLSEIGSRKDKPMVDLYTRKYREKHGIVEPNKIAVTFPTRRAVVEEEKEIEPEKVKVEERVSRSVKQPVQAPSSPTFIVTLDKKPIEVDKMDEAMEYEEEEFVEEEIVSEEEGGEDEEPQGIVVDGKINERCKFWPACRLGDQCLYKHPSKLCKKFPACGFGDKCIYIHPNCRYDGACSRQQCPYTHATPRNRSYVPVIKVPAVKQTLMNVPVCKYFPRCTNGACQFLHPTPCKFGASCTRLGCAFTHPPPAPKHPPAPPKKLLKWVAPGLKKESL